MTNFEQLVLMHLKSTSKLNGAPIRLSTEAEAVCAVLTDQIARLRERAAAAELEMARHKTEHSHGFSPNKESTR